MSSLVFDLPKPSSGLGPRHFFCFFTFLKSCPHLSPMRAACPVNLVCSYLMTVVICEEHSMYYENFSLGCRILSVIAEYCKKKNNKFNLALENSIAVLSCPMLRKINTVSIGTAHPAPFASNQYFDCLLHS
jgi:hypothetical protein